MFCILTKRASTSKQFWSTCVLVLVRVRSDSLADMRLRIRNKTMAVRIFRSGENSKLWRAIFPNCAPVSLGEQRILVKQVFIYLFM